MTEEVTIKEEPELNKAEWVKNEAEYVPPMCMQVIGDQLQTARTKQEPLCALGVGGELQPVYTELETVCFKDEPISMQQPVCLKEEPPCQFDQEFKYEIPVEPDLPPAETPNVKGTKWDCFVRLERLVVPRGAALRHERASQRRERPRARLAPPTPPVSRAHERVTAMKQLSGLLIKRIDKIDNSYTCEICKKQYKNLACLTTHKLGHTKKIRSNITRSDKNFCEICKAVLYDVDRLKVHALIHAKIKIPYLCYICHREFATSHALRTHKRAHEHARPFQCKFCKVRFSRPNDLSRHLAKHRAHRQRVKHTNFCKGCETKQALKQGHLMRSELAQTSLNTDLCELCNK